jgi:hypothetical protein
MSSHLSRILGRILLALTALVALAVGAYAWLFLWPLRMPHPAVHLGTGSLVIRGAQVYVSPDAPVLDHADVLVTDGRIAAVGPSLVAPLDARVVPCDGCSVTAGFWNTHVHFTGPAFYFGSPDGSVGAWSASSLIARLA